MYESVTRDVRVCVSPAYLDDQSDPEAGRFLWSYTVTIENRGRETVQLMSRYWHITDASGHVQEVRGPGVVGAQPVIEPGQVFEYTSGCPLPTASGAMAGSYEMKAASGNPSRPRSPPSCLKARTSAAKFTESLGTIPGYGRFLAGVCLAGGSHAQIIENRQRVACRESLGNCACTTCHVWVKEGAELISEMEDDEADKLDMAADLQLNSRLGCQAVIKAWQSGGRDSGVEPKLRFGRTLKPGFKVSSAI